MPNKWVKESLRLAIERNYLDRLIEIYPPIPTARDPLPEEIRTRIRELYEGRKMKELIVTILDVKRKYGYPFPIEHPYAALLGDLNPELRDKIIKLNPNVVETLSKILLDMGVNGIIRGMERPPDINRQLGHAFQQWLRRKFSDKSKFIFLKDLNYCPKDKICFFDGKDTAINKYVRTKLGIKAGDISFRRDVLVRVKDKIIIAEARFLSTSGGSQTRDINNTIEFIRKVQDLEIDNFVAIGLLDGIVWLNPSYRRMMESLDDNITVMSALLFDKFLEELTLS